MSQATALASEADTADEVPPAARVGVRVFCELVFKAGDLDQRFTPAPSGSQGMSGHQAVASKRTGDYQSEVEIKGVVDGLKLGGRIDGLIADRPLLEEIKTTRGGPHTVRDNHRSLHWAQIKSYGALYCRANDLPAVELRVVYFDIDAREEHPETETFSAEALGAFLTDGVAIYNAWMAQQAAHQRQRDTALKAMRFPYEHSPNGQRQLVRSVSSALEAGTPLLAEAPTGIGKTLGTLYPTLKALGAGLIDKVFFLTAKTSGRIEAVNAIQSLTDDDLPSPPRVLELTARSKACEHPDKACHGDSCPLARGFYDRLPNAREAAQHASHLGPTQMRSIAADHHVCPYYLSQEMVRWSDVVIGDINYYWDQTALLHGLTQQHEWRAAVLNDEAHNLVHRGRAMYSAVVSQSSLRSLRQRVPPEVSGTLQALEETWTEVLAEAAKLPTELARPPQAFVDALTEAVSHAGGHLAADPAHNDPELLDWYFESLSFLRLAESFGGHSLCDLEAEPDQSSLFRQSLGRLSIHNVLPAPHLAPRVAAAHTVIAFSATLTPADFYHRMLGFPSETNTCQASSAFSSDQLDVRRITHIPTTYRRRSQSAGPIADCIAEQYQSQPGNYIAYFSSFAYLDEVAKTFTHQHGSIPTVCQEQGMSEARQNAVLQRLGEERGLVVFAVLGGTFAEGINLVGEQLSGAFIATLGLPPYSEFNQRMASRIDAVFGEGTGDSYVFTYPGLRKVVQAAGRVIRSQHDRGTVCLIDHRYQASEVRALLPSWWAA